MGVVHALSKALQSQAACLTYTGLQHSWQEGLTCLMSGSPGLLGAPWENFAVHIVYLALISDHDQGIVRVLALWVLLASDGEDAIYLVLLAGFLEDSNLGSIQGCCEVCPFIRMKALHFPCQ